MILIWKGLGLLVPGLLLIGFVVPIFMGGSTLNPDGTKHYAMWPSGLGLTLAAIAIWFLGRHLNSTPPRHLIDANTGEDVVIHRTHSFFFIPFQYWAFVALSFGLLLVALELSTKS